jgi:hypothetical protein
VKLRVVHAGLLAALLLGTGLLFHFRPWSAPAAIEARQRKPLEIIPAGSAFVLSADLVELGKSPLVRRLLSDRLRDLTRKEAGCELDPLRDLDELVISVPSAARLGEELSNPFTTGAFALVASGRFRAESVAACATSAIKARAGEPVRTQIGSFVGVRDRKRGDAEIVARDGLLVLSEGSYLRALLDAADGKGAEGSELERTQDRLHGELRRKLGERAPLRATLALSPGWLEQALADPDARASPLAKLRSAAAGVELGDSLSFRALLVSETPDDRLALEALLRDLARDAGLTLSTRASGVELEVQTAVSEATLELLLRARER